MKKVIVADDNEFIRETYTDILENYLSNTEVVAVPDGESLVEEVKKGDYSFVLTDNSMGSGITGIEAIREIRKSNGEVPIYMISADDMKEKAREAGATGYFQKPTPIGELMQVISQYLK